jgi:hypothetical protein
MYNSGTHWMHCLTFIFVFLERLYESINEIVVKEGHYRSAPEFILECTRQELNEIKKNRIDQRKINVYWHSYRQKKIKMKEA